MNSANTEKLVKSFPNLYPQMHPLYPESEQVPFYFECGDGWFALLWDLSLKIEADIVAIKSVQDSNDDNVPFATQVKEKFGMLRFYMSSETEAMSEAILDAERRSGVTCEVCGELGQRRDGGWVSTLCDLHARK